VQLCHTNIYYELQSCKNCILLRLFVKFLIERMNDFKFADTSKKYLFVLQSCTNDSLKFLVSKLSNFVFSRLAPSFAPFLNVSGLPCYARSWLLPCFARFLISRGYMLILPQRSCLDFFLLLVSTSFCYFLIPFYWLLRASSRFQSLPSIL
jgi:hypothetical protein